MPDRSDARILAPLGAADQRKFMEFLSQLVQVNNEYSRAPLDHEMLEQVMATQRGRKKKG